MSRHHFYKKKTEIVYSALGMSALGDGNSDDDNDGSSSSVDSHIGMMEYALLILCSTIVSILFWFNSIRKQILSLSLSAASPNQFQFAIDSIRQDSLFTLKWSLRIYKGFFLVLLFINRKNIKEHIQFTLWQREIIKRYGDSNGRFFLLLVLQTIDKTFNDVLVLFCVLLELLKSMQFLTDQKWILSLTLTFSNPFIKWKTMDWLISNVDRFMKMCFRIKFY